MEWNEMPLEEVVALWVQDVGEILRARTLEGYLYCLGLLVKSGIGKLEDATPERIAEYLSTRRAEGITARTANRNLYALLSLCTWCTKRGKFERGRLEALRSLKLRCLPPPSPKFITYDEFLKAWPLAHEVHPLLYLAVGIVMHEGLRLGELIQCHHEDWIAGASAPYLLVPRDGIRENKTGRERTVPVPVSFLAELSRLGVGPPAKGPIFPAERRNGTGSPYLQRNTLERWLAIWRAAAKLPPWLNYLVLRHSYATHMLETETLTIELLSKAMGNSITVCMKHYVGRRGGDVRVNRAFPARPAAPRSHPGEDIGAAS